MPYYDELKPTQAWASLPNSEWDEDKARHLLGRIGFSATPRNVAEAVDLGLPATIEKYFSKPRSMHIPKSVSEFARDNREVFQNMRRLPEKDRPTIRQNLRRESQEVYLDYGIEWLWHTRKPDNSPYEKLVMFLQDVFVTGLPKVRNPYLLFLHQNVLRKNATGSYDELCKKVSRSPAMIQYLDLQNSRSGNPNENFARELFELFTLGEGKYSEVDIKEAARAFTGYRTNGFEYHFIPRLHDGGRKTIFGQKGLFNGDGVIDLIFEQSAAQIFLPNEFLRFYLSSDHGLEPAYGKRLGNEWRHNDFNLGFLLRMVFTSKLFYHPQFRGNMIKSPTHFYLGLLQDLNLEVAPLPRIVMNALRNMGQPFYAPPNVRGWVGGKSWINSSTLAARQQLAEALFLPMSRESLNADEVNRLQKDRFKSEWSLSISEEKINRVAALEDEEMIDHLTKYLLSGSNHRHIRSLLLNYLQNSRGNRNWNVRNLLIALLQSPQYQLC